MPATINIKLGDYEFGGVVDAFGLQLASRLNEQSVARRHGAYLADIPLLDKGVIRLQGMVFGEDAADSETQLLLLGQAFNVFGQQKFYYWSDKFWVAVKSTWNWEAVPGTPGTAHKFQAELHCPDPYLYEDAITEDTQNPDGSDLTFDLVNGSYADVYPRTTFTADKGAAITACTLSNLTTGLDFIYGGTVAIDKTLLVDPCDQQKGITVRNNGVEDLVNVGGTFPVLLLPGTNHMKFVGSACTLLNEWRHRWAT
jgi:hypothetical protein